MNHLVFYDSIYMIVVIGLLVSQNYDINEVLENDLVIKISTPFFRDGHTATEKKCFI